MKRANKMPVHSGGEGGAARQATPEIGSPPLATSSNPGKKSRARSAALVSSAPDRDTPPTATEPRAGKDGEGPKYPRDPRPARPSKSSPRGRREGANAHLPTIVGARSPGDSIPAGADGEDGASVRAPTTRVSPLSPDAPAGGEDGHFFVGARNRHAALATTIQSIIELGGRRRFAIAQQIRLDNALGAMVRRTMGWRLDLPDGERDAIKKAAQKLIAAVAKGEPVDHPAGAVIAPLVVANHAGRQAFDALRDNAESEMRKLARTLPAYAWVKGTLGFGELGFAVVVAEAGDIGAYGNPAKLWKRCGLAVIRGQRQGNPGSGATADEWIEHGYNKRRRAEMYTFFSDTMLRAVWRGEKDGVAAHAIGHYGEVYGAKKVEYLDRVALTADLAPKDPNKWTPKRADMAARRYMTKRVLRDLWREWRKAVGPSASVIGEPDAASSAIETASSSAGDTLTPAIGAPSTKRRGRRAAIGRLPPALVSPRAGPTTIQPDAQP